MNELWSWSLYVVCQTVLAFSCFNNQRFVNYACSCMCY